MKIITRREWGAAKPLGGYATVDERHREWWVQHYTGGPAGQSMREIQAWMMGPKKNLIDFGYNFAIRATTGDIYEGRGFGVVGAHCPGFNTSGLGVVFIGAEPSDQAKSAARWLYEEANDRAGHVLKPRVHRQLQATDCPGDVIAKWVTGGGLTEGTAHRVLLLTSPHMNGPDVAELQQAIGVKVDGVFGPMTDAAVRAFQKRHHLVVDGVAGPKTRAAAGLE